MQQLLATPAASNSQVRLQGSHSLQVINTPAGYLRLCSCSPDRQPPSPWPLDCCPMTVSLAMPWLELCTVPPLHPHLPNFGQKAWGAGRSGLLRCGPRGAACHKSTCTQTHPLLALSCLASRVQYTAAPAAATVISTATNQHMPSAATAALRPPPSPECTPQCPATNHQRTG